MTTATARPAEGALPPLPARVVGVLTSPRATFARLAADPRWLGMLLLTMTVTIGATTWLLSTDSGQQALLDQQVATLESFGRVVSDEMYAAMQDRLPYAAYLQAGTLLVAMPLVTFAVAGLLFGVFSGLLGGDATYRQVLAIVTHAGAVSIVQQLFSAPLNYARESLSSPTNLSVFFPMLAEESFLAAVFGTIDLFIAWWIVILAIGLGVLYRRKTSGIATGLFAVYGVIALAIAAVKSALGGQ
jgi:hypothetical protein